MTVVLLSGGMDSCVASFLARETWGDPIHALTIEYGQRHYVELDAARMVCEALEPKSKRTANMGTRGVGFGSLLQKTKGEIVDAAASVVPGRNLYFLIAACTYAQKVKSKRVVIGSCLEDQEDYLDCRPGTIEAQAEACRLGLGWDGEIAVPFYDTSKQRIIELADELEEACWSALGKTWSCYDPQEGASRFHEKTPCGKCPACKVRATAFDATGIKDPAHE